MSTPRQAHPVVFGILIIPLGVLGLPLFLARMVLVQRRRQWAADPA